MEGDHPQEKQYNEQHDRRDGMTNGPGRDISHVRPESFKTGLTSSPSCRNAPAVATTCSLLLTPSAMVTPFCTIPDTRTARRSTLCCGVHDQDITALVVGQHRGLRQNRPIGIAHRHVGARECAGPQIRVRSQGYSNHSQTGLRIDDGTEQADVAFVDAGCAGQAHIDGLTDLELRQILLGDLPSQLDFTAFR